ncbi:MAG TPA: sugar ABC transporter permease [Thermomicrobiales bacterium]|nr:sugar ABC transporter permease [Thermomicrobiales bacterium]
MGQQTIGQVGAAGPVTGIAEERRGEPAAPKRGRGSDYRLPFLYILPAAAVLGLVTLYPIVYQIYMSLTDYTRRNLRGNPPEFVGLDNFARILTNDLGISNFNFYRTLAFNVTWTVTNVFFHVTIGIAIALLLNRKRRIIGRRFFRSVFIFPWAMPPLVVAIVWRNMFNREFGAVNLLLGSLGIPNDIRWLESTNAPISFLGFLPLAFYAVLLVNVWLGWPFMMVVATGALQSIPGDLYEAATIDGANRWRQLWDITVPLLQPAMVPAIMYGSILTFNQFNVIYFITGGGPFGRTQILVTQAFELVNPQGLYGVAAAYSIIIFFVLLAITLLQNRYLRGLEVA